MASQLFFCTKCQNQALKCKTSNTMRGKKRKKGKKTHTHRYNLIFSGEKVAVVNMTCFCSTNVGSPVRFALLYTLKCETSEGTHTKSSEHFPQPCCELSLQEILLQTPRQTLREPRLHGGVLLISREGEGASVSIRV